MREGGDSRYSHSSPKLMTNDECHASFMGGRSRAWAFAFVRGRPFLCVGDRLHAWVTIFMCGRLSSCVGDRLHVWATVFMWEVVLMHSTSQSPTDSCRTQRIPEDSSGLHYNLSDFELEENNSESPQESSGLGQSLEEFLLN